MQAPTGAGKTVVFSAMCKMAIDKGNKVLIITDRKELLNQTDGSLDQFNITSYNIEAGSKYVDMSYSCFVAMSQTLKRRIKEKYWIEFISRIDLIIIDEAHKQEFNYLFSSGLVDNKHIIGATATPRRSGKMRQMGLDYEAITSTITVKELIDKGFLVNSDNYGFGSPDISDVEIDRMSGDYKPGQLFEKFNETKRYGGVVKNYLELTPKTKSICFCVNIEHAIKTTMEFRAQGIKAKYIVSNKTKPKDGNPDGLRAYELYKSTFAEMSGKRTEIFNQFQNDEFDILVNADIATTGVDIPSVDTIILNRATTSLTLYLQMIGRGSRIFEGKTHFNILDFGGNIERFGNYDDNRKWYLWHEESKEGGVAPVKECGYTPEGISIKGRIEGQKGCRRLIHAGLVFCPFCGFQYPEKVIKEVELQLQVGVDGVKRIRDMTNENLYEYWKARGHKSAWLWRQLWYRGGENAIRRFGKQYGWSFGTIEKAISLMSKLTK